MKYLLLSFVTSVFIVNTHAALTTEETQHYTEAKTLYNGQSFNGAYEILSSLYLNALDDPQLNFYLGRSAYEVGEYSMALAAFERVKELDPSNIRNQLELAKTQYRVKLYDESKKQFEEVLKTPKLPDNVQKTVQYYLSNITKQQQRGVFFINARAGFLYDSNVNYSSSDDTYTLPDYGTFPNSDPISDSAHEENLNFTHLYDIGTLGGLIVRNDFNLYQRRYFDEHDYDLLLLSYYPALIWNTPHSLYELIAGVDRFTLGDKSYYTSFSVNPKWTYAYSPTLRHIVSFKGGSKHYFEMDTLDNHSAEIDLGLEYYPTSYSTLRIDVLGERQIKEGGSRIDVNYNQYGAALLYTHQIFPMSLVQLHAGFNQRDYEEYSTLFQSYRRDKTEYGSFNLIQRINNTVSAELVANYTHADSTLSVYDYDKYTLSLNLSGRF
jgi:tetratricopeptide (TPR) repeat protein